MIAGADNTHAFWWVNNKQTHSHEIGGGYIWSPLKRSDGGRNEFYENMHKVRPGDVIFAFAFGHIQAVGVSVGSPVVSPKPAEFSSSGANWSEEGWRVPIKFAKLVSPLRPKDHMDVLAPVLPKKYSPIQLSGNGNQGAYLASIPADMAAILTQLLGEQWQSLDLANESELQDLSNDESENFVEQAIHNRTDLPETTKLALVKARRGQGLYRKNLEQYERCCRVTGIGDPRHLRASHMKPWRASTTFEKLDGNNGLLLSPHIDHLFDRGYISFTDEGILLTSPSLNTEILKKWGITEGLHTGNLRPEQLPYLLFHRESIFQDGSSSQAYMGPHF